MKVEEYHGFIASHRTGNLMDINVSTITSILGFEPNIDDDPDKVENSWGFEVDGVKCAVWDWKGSHEYGQFSTFGPNEVFEKLFGTNYL